MTTWTKLKKRLKMNENNLHEYQKRAVEHIINIKKCGLFMDMGLGKTVSTLTAINTLMNDYLEINKVLIIAPKRVIESVWQQETQEWEHLKHLRCSIISGTEKKRLEKLKEKADIYLISRDNIGWLCGLYGGGMLPFDMLVIDESSSFKNPKSQRFKALKLVRNSFDRTVILTGTPSPNSLLDLWPQVYLLDGGQRLGKTITSYRNDYFNAGKRNGAIIFQYVPKKGAEKEIYRHISDICMSMKAEDYLNLPKRIDNYVRINLPLTLQKKYNDFEKDQILELLNSGEITAVSAAALSNKLLQFANGAVYDEDRNVHEIHNLKIEAVNEIIENNEGKPVLIAYTYKHDLQRLQESLKKYNPVKLEKDEDIQNWNAGKIKVLLLHPASGGHGLNLQTGGNTIIWFGQTWSLELYMQFNARLHRQGQREAVIIHHLICSNTIDEDVVKALRAKEERQNGLMDAIKARIKKYLK